MAGALLWGWDATNKKWIPLQVDTNGYVKVDMSNINLNDLADVSVASPADDDLFYYDDATGLWKSRKLVDADIPAAIARDTEVTAAVLAEAVARAAAIAAIELDDLANVSVATPTDGYVLYWDNGTSLWECQKVKGSNLSQTFGASATRLQNIIMTPIAGEILRIANHAGGAFSGLIDDTPAAHGGQGLDATHVPYDGHLDEGMFNGLFAYDGSSYWGQIILYNTTKGESCKIVSVDRTNDVITVTADSPDDVSLWGDDDVIDCDSLVNVAGWMDIDISDNVGTGIAAVVLLVVFQNNTATSNANNALFLHPYEAYNAGKRQWCKCAAASECTTQLMILPVISQKITAAALTTGQDDFYVILSCMGTIEFADT